MRKLWRRLWGAICLVTLVAASAGPVAAADIGQWRLGGSDTSTRFVVELSDRVAFNVFQLSSPDRVVIDLAPSRRPAVGGAGRGLVRQVRVGRLDGEVGRIVLDLDRPARAIDPRIVPPRDGQGWRFIVDLAPESPAAAVVPIQPAPTQVVARPPRPRLPVVVIDPGHGGHDPGAVGVEGTFEKALTLEMGLELVRRLEATRRYRVHLTRRDDRFVRLRDRVNAARAHGADLFISLHADSIGRPGHRGVTVYTVSETASDREAEALAAKENKADIIVGVDLGGTTAEVAGILIDLSQRETKNKSTRFARALVEELGKETRLVDQTHRFAGFAVLSAPDVPSVLLELGYLSNREDERQLRTPAHRARLADAAVRAVDRYFAKPTPELVAVQAAATPDSLRRR